MQLVVGEGVEQQPDGVSVLDVRPQRELLVGVVVVLGGAGLARLDRLAGELFH